MKVLIKILIWPLALMVLSVIVSFICFLVVFGCLIILKWPHPEIVVDNGAIAGFSLLIGPLIALSSPLQDIEGFSKGIDYMFGWY